jgi:hypothetical protein
LQQLPQTWRERLKGGDLLFISVLAKNFQNLFISFNKNQQAIFYPEYAK